MSTPSKELTEQEKIKKQYYDLLEDLGYPPEKRELLAKNVKEMKEFIERDVETSKQTKPPQYFFDQLKKELSYEDVNELYRQTKICKFS
ncbi:hypothetical protein TVAG_083010 [Trichomonas vaginalis G3]|uniref:Uncharacterized protein n=1 Tax=Trichomonas vaginalis (strain ATCC PRA-98 / G3) TaxID=412133 RepID=A2DM30_TRIV3|nr:actin binding [Trichomonas vaginalis G3]EAY18450.1 hypothetical protein TVAG_083010 [Trichomonas vaginalis G3]KAI5489561.1 actin binding [Trichomonas vaginalis G3]|eukprot:XP_001579436.1 hypothetical protein [Trichomonas vaginalis G3]